MKKICALSFLACSLLIGSSFINAEETAQTSSKSQTTQQQDTKTPSKGVFGSALASITNNCVVSYVANNKVKTVIIALVASGAIYGVYKLWKKAQEEDEELLNPTKMGYRRA